MKEILRVHGGEKIVQIVELLRELFESREAELPEEITYEPDILVEYLEYVGQNGAIFAVTEEKKIVGVIVGELIQYPYCKKIYAQKWVLYVTPEERGTPVARALLEAFIYWARQEGALEVHVGWSYRIARKEYVGLSMLYKGMGFQDRGKFYILKVN